LSMSVPAPAETARHDLRTRPPHARSISLHTLISWKSNGNGSVRTSRNSKAALLWRTSAAPGRCATDLWAVKMDASALWVCQTFPIDQTRRGRRSSRRPEWMPGEFDRRYTG
jgi:hypothetical protein